MRASDWINLLCFTFFAGLAWVRPLTWRQRLKITMLGVAGAGLILAGWWLQQLGVTGKPDFTLWGWRLGFPGKPGSGWLGGKALSPQTISVLRDWLPAPLMLFPYWQAGAFRGGLNLRWQNRLAKVDQQLFAFGDRLLPRLTSAKPVHIYLEIAYLLCYPLIPLGLAALYLQHLGWYADDYWLAVLPPTYCCYLVLPFLQMLPPRMLAEGANSPSPLSYIRRFNLRILHHGSVQLTTFPSAHVASTMAASLILLQLSPATGGVFLILSVSIAVAAVAGRYHFAADVLLGAAAAMLWGIVQTVFLA
jgi:hypothetical protein